MKNDNSARFLRDKATRTFLLATMAVAASAVYAQDITWTIDGALEQISYQAKNFKTAMGKVDARWTDADGKETRKSVGTTYINADGDIRFQLEGDDGSTVLLNSRYLYVYEPGRALVEEYQLSKHPERLAPFVRLGFSTTGEDLQRDYLVTLLGEDAIGDRRVIALELTPKDDEVRQTVGKVQLWIDQASWLPVKQVIDHTSNGETLTVNFTNTSRNLKLSNKLFDADWPKGTQKIKK
ncbi:MAG: outer-membrane lipoprotein carrier protein LolA [Gammaproteobacteria bacterium]|nr:outer-membrane lipoprotein carrier protein LolA [Gammaproteobacteria bacterium]